jgi:hypothetical protein
MVMDPWQVLGDDGVLLQHGVRGTCLRARRSTFHHPPGLLIHRVIAFLLPQRRRPAMSVAVDSGRTARGSDGFNCSDVIRMHAQPFA